MFHVAFLVWFRVVDWFVARHSTSYFVLYFGRNGYSGHTKTSLTMWQCTCKMSQEETICSLPTYPTWRGCINADGRGSSSVQNLCLRVALRIPILISRKVWWSEHIKPIIGFSSEFPVLKISETNPQHRLVVFWDKHNSRRTTTPYFAAGTGTLHHIKFGWCGT